MSDPVPMIDPILDARLDLLDEVLKELEEILEEMETEKKTLDALERFLDPEGTLQQLRKQAVIKVSDAIVRLELAVESQYSGEIASALDGLRELQPLIMTQLANLRTDANNRLVELTKWSVTALDDQRMRKAAELYRKSLEQIRKPPSPWAQYGAQMRSRGEALLSAYLDMLGSIAIRGIPIGDDLADERKKLLKFLLRPMGSDADRLQLRALNLLTRSEHLPLGYRGWNVWALPLLGQEVGLHLIQNRYLDPPAEQVHQLICADAYAAHVLGPSYAAAAIFLELDPDAPALAGGVSDRVRAELLLEQLPTLAPGPQVEYVQQYADRLRALWEQAKTAVEAGPTAVPDEVREVVGKFLTGLYNSDYNFGLGYDLGSLGDREAEADALIRGESPDGSIHPRDLLVSMWWARVRHPAAHQAINRGARAVLETDTASLAATPPRRPGYGGGRTSGG